MRWICSVVVEPNLLYGVGQDQKVCGYSYYWRSAHHPYESLVRDAQLATYWTQTYPGSMRSPVPFLMDKKRTNQLLGLSREVISTTVAVLTGHCVMGRQAEKMRLPFNDFCCGCRSTEEEETIVHSFFVSALLC